MEFYEVTVKDYRIINEILEENYNFSLNDLAKLIDIDIETLQRLNIEEHNALLSKEKMTYMVRIPLEKIYTFYLRYNMPDTEENTRIKKGLKEKSFMINHRVKMGESLKSLVKLYDTELKDIRRANHLENDFLFLDMLLVIPISQKSFENLCQ